MASPFHITLDPKQKTLALTAGGKGEIVFSHTSAASSSVRGSLRLSKVTEGAGKWVTLDGPPERDFVGTQSFSVKIALPPDAKPGSYTFRLDSFEVANPDENYTEGPTVGFEVKKTEIQPSKPFPWWIAIVAGVVLLVLIGGGVVFALTRGVTIPELAGKPVDQALKQLKDANLDAAAATPPQSVAGLPPDKNNTVVRTDPKAGESVKKGTKVTVYYQVAAAAPPPPPPGQIIRDHRTFEYNRVYPRFEK